MNLSVMRINEKEKICKQKGRDTSLLINGSFHLRMSITADKSNINRLMKDEMLSNNGLHSVCLGKTICLLLGLHN